MKMMDQIEISRRLQQFESLCDHFRTVMNRLDEGTDYPFKAYLCVKVFLSHLDIFPGDQQPLDPMIRVIQWALDSAELALQFRGGDGCCKAQTFIHTDMENREQFENDISSLFASLWNGLEDRIYFDESLELLTKRMELNGIDPVSLFSGREVLDAGCGSGKFACAIARLIAAKVTGIDLSGDAIEFARSQAQRAGLAERMTFMTGSICSLPFADASFDFVWSNGVVHHTVDYQGAIREFYRVLKPGGQLFLYVNGRWGMLETLVDTLKDVCAKIPPLFVRDCCAYAGMNGGRTYWIIDNLYAPYEWKSRSELEEILHDTGFIELKQLTRGLDIDQIEMVSRGVAYAKLKYGDAQLKFLARKG